MLDDDDCFRFVQNSILPNQILKTKKKQIKAFYKERWFKLLLWGAVMVILVPFSYKSTPAPVRPNQMFEITVTLSDWFESARKRNNPIRLYFKTKEYTNRFGIYDGGVFGRWAEIRKALVKDEKLIIRISDNDRRNLNGEIDAVPVYYLRSQTRGLIFNEDDFNRGNDSWWSRIRWFIFGASLLVLWGILSDRKS